VECATTVHQESGHLQDQLFVTIALVEPHLKEELVKFVDLELTRLMELLVFRVMLLLSVDLEHVNVYHVLTELKTKAMLV